MRTISYKLDDLKKVVIPIGYEGENDHTRVIIDAGEVFKQYPAASATLKVKPPHGTIYPVVVSREGDTVIWDVKETDCASNGTGEAQFTFTENSVIVKSMVTKININRSLVATGPAPDPIEDWLDEANRALEEIQAAEVNQPTIGEDGYWYTWNQETGEYEKTETKAQGADGAPGQNGAPGQDGQDATPDLITVDYADLTFPVAKDTQCYHDGLLYYAKQDIQTAEAWTAAHWQQTTVEEQVSQLKNAIQGINEKITTDVFKDIVYDDAYRSNMLNLNGCLEPSVDRDVLKYRVNAGETLHLKIEKEYVWAATYQFQNNSEVPRSDNPYIVGETVTTEVDDDVVVPNGATWLIVSQLKTNETNKIQRGEKADLIGIIEDKLENVENEIFVQDHKDGNVVIFDDHVTDFVISVISRFQYDENGITSAILSKSGKNIASVGFRTDLPSIITGTYPGSVSGYGTTMIPVHGKQVTASMQYDVPVSDTNVRSLYLFYYDKDKTYISYVSTSVKGNNRGFVTIPVGAEYIVFRTDGQTGLTVEGQIEYGTSMTEYEEYKGANYTETFGVTIYGGYLNWNKGLLVSTLASDGSKLNPPVEYTLSENEIVSNGSVTILFANIGIIEASCAMPTAKKIEEIDGEVHPFGTLPGYWEDGSGYLSSKVDTITDIARSCASNADVFYFLTDLHWTLNNKHSPAIIEFLNKRINVPRLFNGGDNADYFKDTAEVSRILRKVMGQGEYYMADGNHEYLQNKTFSDNFYANRMFADKAIYGDAERTYYYVDNPASKMRYVVLATYAPWEGGQSVDRLNNVDQQTWFSNTALNVEDGWTVIVFVHIFSTYNKTLIAGTTAYINAMQSMQHGEVACIIQGDQHHDYTMYVANDTIPIVCSTCDKNTNVSEQTHDVEDYDKRPTGTINEQAFDVVVVDKTNKNVHFVRIGYAKEGDEIRTVHYGGN